MARAAAVAIGACPPLRLAGDDAPVDLLSRPLGQKIITATDPVDLLRAQARYAGEIMGAVLGLLAFVSEAGSDYGALMAASAFVIAPVVLGYFVAQRQFIQGIARTGLR